MSSLNYSTDGYRHCLTIDIRFGDMDAMGHVNNAKYLTYMETARLNYARDLSLWTSWPPGDIGPIMAKVTLEYKLPLNLADRAVDVYTRVIRLGNKSYDMEHLIVRKHDGMVAAYGLVVLVVYDYRNGQSAAIPETWREKIVAYEPGLRGN